MPLPLIVPLRHNSRAVQTILDNLRASSAAGGHRRNPLYFLGFLVFCAFAAKELADYVINDNLAGLPYLALLLIVGSSVVAMLNSWRSGSLFRLPSIKLATLPAAGSVANLQTQRSEFR
jgi:hypothetical protein